MDSLIPMKVVDVSSRISEVVFELVCDMISGGADYVGGLPRTLSLVKIIDGKVVTRGYYKIETVGDNVYETR